MIYLLLVFIFLVNSYFTFKSLFIIIIIIIISSSSSSSSSIVVVVVNILCGWLGSTN